LRRFDTHRAIVASLVSQFLKCVIRKKKWLSTIPVVQVIQSQQLPILNNPQKVSVQKDHEIAGAIPAQ
jgi:hypothetical protein